MRQPVKGRQVADRFPAGANYNYVKKEWQTDKEWLFLKLRHQTSSCCLVFGLIAARFVCGPARQPNGPTKMAKARPNAHSNQAQLTLKNSIYTGIAPHEYSRPIGMVSTTRHAHRTTQHRWNIVDIRSCPVAWQLEKVRPQNAPAFRDLVLRLGRPVKTFTSISDNPRLPIATANCQTVSAANEPYLRL